MYKKILIIRFSSIGDIVVTSAAVRCIRKKYPHAEIHFIVKVKYVEVLQNNPYINKIISFNNQSKNIKKELINNQYDLIIDLHNNLRSHIISWGLGAQKIIRYQKGNFSKWLWVWFKTKPKSNMHTSERYFQALQQLGVVYDDQGLDFFNISTKLPVGFPHESFIAGVLGGTYATKKMPALKWIELIQKTNIPFVLLGGVEEVEVAQMIQAACGRSVYSFCGQLSLAQSAGVLEKSTFVVSHDTGLMHISAALKKPLISIWGNTIPEFGLFPWYPTELKQNSHIFEVAELSCRPCSKLGKSTCPKGHFNCMNFQDTELISEELTKKN